MQKRRAGFSIIEVMLVLAIVFLLFVAMMAVVQASVNRQRYNDTVTSLKEFIQRQYSEVQNVVLDRGINSIRECDADKTRGGNMGRTNCYVVGRLLNFRIEDETTMIKVHQIVYFAGDTSEVKTNQQLKFNDFDLKDASVKDFQTYGLEVEDYQVEWGAILRTSGETPSKIEDLSVLIFRSPESGVVRTHVLENRTVQPHNLKDILTESTGNTVVDMCVVPDSSPNTELRAVRINAGATNASGVEIPLVGQEGVICVGG